MNTDNTLRRLLRKRLTLKRRRPAADGTPRDFGVGVTGVVVTIVILGILAAIGGPPLWRLITDAREHKLNSQPARSCAGGSRPTHLGAGMDGDRRRSGSECVLTSADGQPLDALVTALIEDLPFTWEKSWLLSPGLTTTKQSTFNSLLILRLCWTHPPPVLLHKQIGC